MIIPSIYQNVQHSLSRHQKTTSNLLRINLKGKLKFNHSWPLEGAMYITLWKNFRGHPKNVSFVHFLKILMVSDKTIHKAFRTHTNVQLCKQNPLEKICIFTIYQNYTMALMGTYSNDWSYDNFVSFCPGDHCYKRTTSLPPEEQMISAFPDIQTATLTDEDCFMVVACDGIW